MSKGKAKYVHAYEQKAVARVPSDFVMKATAYYKRLAVIETAACAAVTVLSLFAPAVIGMIGMVLFGILTVWSVIECIHRFSEQITVGQNAISRKVLLGKQVEIAFSDIDRVTRSVKNNADVYSIYVGGKEALKISSLYENIDYFTQLVSKKHWAR